jgi:FkbM family methyltransferase
MVKSDKILYEALIKHITNFNNSLSEIMGVIKDGGIEENKPEIPKKIFQTFEHTNFNPEFQTIIDKWKEYNKEYEYIIHNAEDCREFIKKNFNKEVYDTYNKIKPGAFKADLWRYCILYEYGGYYADIDTLCEGNLDRLSLKGVEFISPIDLNNDGLGYHNIFNTFIGCVPKHPILKECIDSIVKLVKEERLPHNLMNFCGPGCLGMAVNKYLGRPLEESMVGFEGIHNNIKLIYFEKGTEYVKDLNGDIILQNKNGNRHIKRLYDQERTKISNHLDWGLYGYKNVKFERIIKTDPFTLDNKITKLKNYHNETSASFKLFKYCGISDCIRRGFRWEEHNHKVINNLLNENSIAVEVGAHIGTLTVKLSKTAKKVYAFEPIDKTYSILKENLEINKCKNVETYKLALGAKEGFTEVKWISDNNAGGTGLVGGFLSKDSNIDEKIKVKVVTLDSLELPKIDYIKIDAEGYEELVVEGAKKTIERSMPILVIECFNEPTFNNHIYDTPKATRQELQRRFKYLLDLGYKYQHLFFEDFIFLPPRLQDSKFGYAK